MKHNAHYLTWIRTLFNLDTAPHQVQEGEMKPRPTKIQPGATHWNPNAGPDWYAKSLAGRWMYFDAEEGDWDNGQWVLSIGVKLSDLIPVEHLMAQEVGGTVEDDGPQPPEWNGEGLPPFGVDCKITTRTILGTDEYEGIGMLLAQTMDYYVMLMQIDRTPWVRSKDRVTFRPIKSERDQQIDALLSIFQTLPYFVFSRDMAADLYDEGVRVEK